MDREGSQSGHEGRGSASVSFPLQMEMDRALMQVKTTVTPLVVSIRGKPRRSQEATSVFSAIRKTMSSVAMRGRETNQ